MLTSKFKNFLIFCSGSDRNILFGKCDKAEQDKHANIGATVLFTGVFAFISCSYALNRVNFSLDNSNKFIIYFIAVLWATLIFTLDRLLVSSIVRVTSTTNERLRELALFVIRIAIACVIAMTISKPLEVKLFEDVIEHDLFISKRESVTSYYKGSADGYTKSNNNFNDIKKNIDSTRNSKEYKSTLLEYDKTKNDLQVYKRIARRKDTLVSFINSHRDDSDSFSKAQNELKHIENKYPELQSDISSKQSYLQSLNGKLDGFKKTITFMEKEAGTAIKAMEHYSEEYKYNLEQLKKDDSTINKSFNPSFMNQVSQLHKSSINNELVYWVNIFLTLLFFLVEILPILTKLMSPIGPYDYYLKDKYDSAALEYDVKKGFRSEIATSIKGKIAISFDELATVKFAGRFSEKLDNFLNASLKPLFDVIFERSINVSENNITSDFGATTVTIDGSKTNMLIAETVMVAATAFSIIIALRYFNRITDINIAQLLSAVFAGSGLYFAVAKFKYFGK